MLLFCPLCSNLLIITRTPSTALAAESGDGLESHNRFECRTCPYQKVLDRRYFERRPMAATRRKAAADEDVVGGAASWENVDRTDVNCPQQECAGRQAYFRQVQIRSADEPMTSFYKCVECGREWREN